MDVTVRFRSQRGATLLVIMGIIAALAVMAATLVLVVGNMQANTKDSRTREKAATVGEAAMDAQMYALALHWPKTSVPNPAPTLDATRLRSQFPASEFPNSTNDFVGAVYYDDSDTNGDGVVDLNDAHWDANGNHRMYVEAQSKVNGRAVRFQALVERTFFKTTFPRGIAVYDGGAMDSNGGGNNPKITVYNAGDLPGVSSYVNGAIGAPAVFDTSTISVTTPPAIVPPLSALLPDSIVAQVIALSQALPGNSNAGNRYYDCTNNNPNGPDTIPGNANMQGICVIRVPDGTTVNLSGGINMDQGPHAVPQPSDEPGILMVLGPEPEPAGTNTGNLIKIDMANNDRFYGVFLTDGQLDFAHGTPAFFGMAIFKSYMDMRGTADIRYDDSAITKLFDSATLSVVLVPNTWREIHPR
jgi:hypothetical protein